MALLVKGLATKFKTPREIYIPHRNLPATMIATTYMTGVKRRANSCSKLM
jgi:hypothetical protein